jgi:hypothetical protein
MEALEEEQSGDDIFPAEEPKSKTHCTSSFNQTKQSESVNAKVSQDSGIASISRRDSELSIADEGTVLKNKHFLCLTFFNQLERKIIS